MFNIRCFEMRKLAKFLSANIDVYYVTPTDVVVGVGGKRSKPLVVNEIRELPTVSHIYEKILFIHVNPNGVCVFGDDYSGGMSDIVELFTREFECLKIKKYSQGKACSIVKDTVEDFSSKTLNELSSALIKEPNLDERDGYYGTLGEKAFFRLVELGRVNIDDAFEEVFDIKESI